HIPTHYVIKDVQAFYDHFFLDKKSHNNKIKFILPKGIGGYQITDSISKESVIAVLKRFSN
ncbi:MAG: 3-dehydroquinate synthase, partial [Arcobacteraceae bacterium]|nr:3-dehydroquinate synthase [Arcobacteraceae bacterium]